MFELSKCEQPGIRARMVANLRNVDEAFAAEIADGLGLDPIPAASTPARAPITDLPPSPALSIVDNGPASFAGRKIGVARSPTAPIAGALDALRKAAGGRGRAGRARSPRRSAASRSATAARCRLHQNVDGGPSVLYDAVAILASADGAAAAARRPGRQGLRHDAHAHCKFIGYTESSRPLLDAAGVAASIDDGYVQLDTKASFTTFVERCRDLRYWPRQLADSPA